MLLWQHIHEDIYNNTLKTHTHISNTLKVLLNVLEFILETLKIIISDKNLLVFPPGQTSTES